MCLGPKKGIHKFHGRHCTALLGSEHVLPALLTSATIQETIFGCGWPPCFSDFSSAVRNANERSLIAVSAMENVRHFIRMRFARRSAVIHCLQHSEMILEGLSPDVFQRIGTHWYFVFGGPKIETKTENGMLERLGLKCEIHPLRHYNYDISTSHTKIYCITSVLPKHNMKVKRQLPGS